jgi:hypothetical protein
MKTVPQVVLDIGWDEGDPELGFAGESETVALLRGIYEDEDLEARAVQLDTGFQWFDVPGPDATRWAQCVLPLLSDENDPLLPEVLIHLAGYASMAVDAEDGGETEASPILAVLQSGYDRYLELFHLAPYSVIGLLTICSGHAAEYLPRIFAVYDAEPDPEKKAWTIVALARVALEIPDWRKRLLDGIQRGADSALTFVCAIELMALDGDATSSAIVDLIVATCVGDGASRLFGRCMRRGLPGLSRDRQIALLVRILGQERYTGQSLLIAKFLLEAVYGRIGVISDHPDLSSDPALSTRFRWVGPPRTHVLRPPAGEHEEDWLAALLKSSSLWREVSPYRPPKDDELRSNLYELFGLPSDREGLLRLWREAKGGP